MGFICMSVTKNFKAMASHSASLWNRGLGQLGNSLFWSMFCWHRRFHINRKRWHKIYKFSRNLFGRKICSRKRLKGIIKFIYYAKKKWRKLCVSLLCSRTLRMFFTWLTLFLCKLNIRARVIPLINLFFALNILLNSLSKRIIVRQNSTLCLH